MTLLIILFNIFFTYFENSSFGIQVMIILEIAIKLG
jgi:hypothetical protein